MNGQEKHATMKNSIEHGAKRIEQSAKRRAEGILDCAHVKSALPFHICENLTGQGLWNWGKQRAEGKGQRVHYPLSIIGPCLRTKFLD